MLLMTSWCTYIKTHQLILDLNPSILSRILASIKVYSQSYKMVVGLPLAYEYHRNVSSSPWRDDDVSEFSFELQSKGK